MKFTPINIVVEKIYLQTPWWLETRAGLEIELARNKLKPNYIYSSILPADNSYGLAILVGATDYWINSMIEQSHQRGVKAVLASTEPVTSTSGLSCVTVSRTAAMMDVVQYLYACGHQRMAYFGMDSDSVTDLHRYDGFMSMTRYLGIPAPDDSVFICTDNMDDCLTRFADVHKKFDAVICNNDLTAAFLLANAVDYQLSIPNDLFVVGFGNTFLGRCASPSLTTSTLNLFEVGRQAVKTGLYSLQNTAVLSSITTVASTIIVRQSTDCRTVNTKKFIHEPLARSVKKIGHDHNLAKGPSMATVYHLEQMISLCGEIDLKIIQALKNGLSYPKIAETIFISDSTLHYHIKKLYKMVAVSNRDEFVSIINKYMLGRENFCCLKKL